MIYQDIVDSVNNKIENSNFEKFSIDHIVDEINQVNRDLANKTQAFETMEYMPLWPDYQEYPLPMSIFRPSRATYRGIQIDFKAQEDMDLWRPNWEATTADRDLQTLVYSNLSNRRVIPFPKLIDTDVVPAEGDMTYLGQLSDVGLSGYQFLYINKYTGAKYLADEPYGTISGFNMVEVVAIYGAFLPEKVLAVAIEGNNGLNATVELDEIYANALIFGVAGNLLFTSGRTEDIVKGERFMKIYGLDETEVGALRDRQFSSGFRDTSRGVTYYRTPFQI